MATAPAAPITTATAPPIANAPTSPIVVPKTVVPIVAQATALPALIVTYCQTAPLFRKDARTVKGVGGHAFYIAAKTVAVDPT